MNCLYCGKITKKDTTYCNDTCEKNYTSLFSQDTKPVFRTFQEAGKFYNKDFRTMKKFEGSLFTIDKTLSSASTKWVICKTCGEQSPKSKARAGYCTHCRIQGLGKKQQGRTISTMYKGKGNPNYIHGNAPSTDYTDGSWLKLKKQLDFKECALSGLTDNIDYHHILPRWFCALANIDVYDTNNIIGLNHQYHKAVHHLQLDLLLLPNLYSLYRKDAQQLHSQFLNLLRLHKVHQYPVHQLQKLDLFQIARYPGKKKLLNLLPEFLPPFLNQKGS
jgi:hypothetical protein